MGSLRIPLLDKITGKLNPDVIPDLSGDYLPVNAAATWLDLDSYRQVGDTDDTQAFVRCIAAAIAGSVKLIRLRSAAYYVGSSIDLAGANGVVFQGLGEDVTTIYPNGTSSTINQVFTSTGACSNITFRDLAVVGDVIDDVTGPRRSRTYTPGSHGFNTAFGFLGDLNPTPAGTGRPKISNLKLRNVRIQGSRGLPFWFDGIDGYTSTFNVETYLTMDGGWTYCRRVVFDRLRSYKSADNGFSFSRGCMSIVGGIIDVEMCNTYGVWVSGFVVNNDSTDYGPTNFSIDTINVRNAGAGFVALMDAPSNGRIGNVYGKTALRGSSDQPSDLLGIGITVYGSPSNALTTPTAYATSVLIQNALLIDCRRGGIAFSGTIDCAVGQATVINAGSQYKADGTTAVSSGDASNNFGFAVIPGAEATNTRPTIRQLKVIDNRGTPYTNFPLYTTGAVNPEFGQISYSGTRQALTTNDFNPNTEVHGGTHLWTGNTKHTQGGTAGSNTASGTVSGFDVNGAAGSTRMNGILTGGVKRWLFGGNTTAEAGSAAGTDFEVRSYDDAGTLLQTVLRIMRATGVVNFLRGTARNRVSQTLAANGVVTIDASAGDIQAITLNASASSSSITNPTVGQELDITWFLNAAAVTYAWPSNCKFAGGAAPTASTTNGWKDRVTFIYTGSNWEEKARSIGIR